MNTKTTPVSDATESAQQVDFGRRMITFRTRNIGPLGPITGIFSKRNLVVSWVLVLACGVAGLAALMFGQYQVSPAGVWAAFRGEADALTTLVVTTWRLPRAVAAAVLGGALGAAGAIFQTLTRNPLGSPDIIGFNAGAVVGASAVILYFPGPFVFTAAGAFVGGLVTAAVVYWLATTGGTVHSFRLIIIGIGVAAMLTSLHTAMIINAEVEEALQVAIWGAGTLNGLTMREVVPAIIGAVIAFVVLCGCSRRLKLMELGDDLAESLGAQLRTSRLVLIALGVLLTALCAALAGPISFVALAAPQLARRLAGSAGIPLVGSVLMGAVLLQVSDVLAQNIYPPSPLPVGVITVCLGGGYFLWLLIMEVRKR